MTADIETWRRRGEVARLAHEAVNRAFREHVREREPDRYAALLADFREKTAAAEHRPGVICAAILWTRGET